MRLKSRDIDTLSIEELSKLHEEIGQALTRRIEEEKHKLEIQLARLSGAPSQHRKVGESDSHGPSKTKSARRPYPPVRPKFRNPANATETWAGRGKQPRWLVAELRAGKRLEDFLIARKAASRPPKRA